MVDNINIVPTGKIVKDYLTYRNITQADLSKRTGYSEKHISNVLNGKASVTEGFAVKLEKVMPDIPASYWINYESKYREQKIREEQYQLNMDELKDIAMRFRFKDVYKGLGLTIREQAEDMLKILRISDFSQFDAVYATLDVDFMEDGGTKEAIAVWMGLCREELETLNEVINVEYSSKKLKENLIKLKEIANNNDLESSLKSCKKLLNRLGVYFVVCDAVPGCKVRGALTPFRGHPAIYISKRFKTIDNVWFAIIHEIAHLLLHYNKSDTILTMDDESGNLSEREKEANDFAVEFFIGRKEYNDFVNKKDFSEASIVNFSAIQGVVPAILVGQLQHDQYVSRSALNYLK